MATYEIVIYGTVILAFLGILFVWIYLEMKAKCRVRVKELIKGRKLVRDYRAAEFEDKDGVKWWRLHGERMKSRRLLAAPPEEAIELNHKGKKYAECYRTETGDIIWIVDKGEVKQFPQELWNNIPKEILKVEDKEEQKEKINAWKKHVKLRWEKENKVIEAYDPVTTKQRMIYLHNLRKAESRRGWDWKRELVPIVSIGALVLLAIAGMVFWGDLAKPALDANAQALELRKLDLEIVQYQKEIMSGQQIIRQDLEDLEKKVPN